MITVFGFVIGLTTDFGAEAAMKALTSIDPHVILLVFMPALIFESAFNSEWYIFKKEIGKILLMAGPIMLLCVALTAVAFGYVLDYQS